jgi:thiol-disulfide isomerase/thioredoxin
MRIIYLLMISALLSCKGPSNSEQQKQVKEVGEKESLNSQFTDLQGNGLELDDFKGKPLLVNYWATWCVPCLKEFPSFVSLQDSLQDDEIVLLFASPDKLDKIRDFRQTKGYDFEFVHLNPSLDKLEIYALPATFVYDSNGDLHKRIDGAMNWNTLEVIEMLKQVP